MIDRNALAQEMRKASWDTIEDWDETSADVAMRHIQAARAEALEEAATVCELRSDFSGRDDFLEGYNNGCSDCADAIRAFEKAPGAADKEKII